MHNFDPVITIESIECHVFSFKCKVIVKGLPVKTQCQLWLFYPDGTSPSQRNFVSDDNGGYSMEPSESSSDTFQLGEGKIGINIGEVNVKNYSFKEWSSSSALKWFTPFTMYYEKETILLLDDIGKHPWGNEITISGWLWFKGEPWTLPNGATWFAGRRIHFTGDDTGKGFAYTNNFSRFSERIKLGDKPKYNCSLQAYYDGDNKYFDKCDSNIVYYNREKHNTLLTLEADTLRLKGISSRENKSNHIKLDTNQYFRIVGKLTDTDTGALLENKKIVLDSDIPLISQESITANDGSFEIRHITAPSKSGIHSIAARFTGDSLYYGANSNKLKLYVEEGNDESKVNVKIIQKKQILGNDLSQKSVNPKIFHGRNFTIDNELCFVLIPFTDQFFRIHQDCIKPVLQKRFKKVMTARDIFISSSMIEDIWIHINTARLVVADVTGKNPNVFYELGVTHTLGKDFIILTQSKNDVPFDISHIRYIHYGDNKSGWEMLKEKLSNFVDSTLSQT